MQRVGHIRVLAQPQALLDDFARREGTVALHVEFGGFKLGLRVDLHDNTTRLHKAVRLLCHGRGVSVDAGILQGGVEPPDAERRGANQAASEAMLITVHAGGQLVDVRVVTRLHVVVDVDLVQL